jgi:hypothetical protein
MNIRVVYRPGGRWRLSMGALEIKGRRVYVTDAHVLERLASAEER